MQNSIIGIGLNVNQEVFENLPNASSLKNLTGRSYDLEELLQLMVVEIKQYLSKVMDEERFKQLQALYEGVLFRRNKPATFKGKSGELFMGFIKGVSQEGKLVVALEDHVLEMFDLKEIQLLY